MEHTQKAQEETSVMKERCEVLYDEDHSKKGMFLWFMGILVGCMMKN